MRASKDESFCCSAVTTAPLYRLNLGWSFVPSLVCSVFFLLFMLRDGVEFKWGVRSLICVM